MPRFKPDFPPPVLRRMLCWVLKRLREIHALEVSELAARAGLGESTVRDIENARARYFSWENVTKICHALHRHPEHVVALCRRYLRLLFWQQMARHAPREEWLMVFPWSRK